MITSKQGLTKNCEIFPGVLVLMLPFEWGKNLTKPGKAIRITQFNKKKIPLKFKQPKVNFYGFSIKRLFNYDTFQHPGGHQSLAASLPEAPGGQRLLSPRTLVLSE